MFFFNNPYITGYYNALYTLNNQRPFFIAQVDNQPSKFGDYNCSGGFAVLSAGIRCILKIVKGQKIRRTLVELFDTPTSKRVPTVVSVELVVRV